MAKTTIKITGLSLKAPRTREDGITEILFKIPMSKAVPKGLECLGESAYKVLISPKTWKNFTKKNVVNKDTFYIIEGETKATVTSKGIPFITVVCFNMQAKPQDISKTEANKEVAKIEKDTLKTEVNKENATVEKNTSDLQSTKKADEKVKKTKAAKNKISNNEQKDKNNWRKKINEEDLIELSLSDIDIDDAKHKYGFIPVGDKIGINSLIAVTKKDNGRYSLIAGYKAFVSAKVYRDKEPVKVYVYNKDRKEFIKEFGIDR